MNTARFLLIFLLIGCAAYAQPKEVNYDESKVPGYTLPDVLATQAGGRVADADTWLKVRRPEILDLFRTHVYGRAPGRPGNMKFETIIQDENALGGLAIHKTARVCFTTRPDGPCMNIHIYQPKAAEGPVPIFVGIKVFDPTEELPMPGKLLKEQLGSIWKYAQDTGNFVDGGVKPIGKLPGDRIAGVILKRGYAFATINPEDIAPDDPETYDSGVIGEFSGADRAARAADAWGAIGAWAWALSRALDYFETDDTIDHTRVIAIGHSRRGKTALWAGAQDVRFAVVISNNSGCAGAAISRRAFGETVAMINNQFPHWFCANYKKYNDSENELPLDQHMLLSLIAPRPVYVASAADDLWADPRGEFLSALNAEPVYRLLGGTGLGVTDMPALNYPVGGDIGYHIRSGGHALTDYDWLQYLDFADRHLK